MNKKMKTYRKIAKKISEWWLQQLNDQPLKIGQTYVMAEDKELPNHIKNSSFNANLEQIIIRELFDKGYDLEIFNIRHANNLLIEALSLSDIRNNEEVFKMNVGCLVNDEAIVFYSNVELRQKEVILLKSI